MPLNDLSLPELFNLSNDLTELHDAMVHLDAAGFEPRLDLTPGQPGRITVKEVMPPLGGSTRRSEGLAPDEQDWVQSQVRRAQRDAAFRQIERRHYKMGEFADPTPSIEAAQPEPAPEPEPAPAQAGGPPPAVEGQAGGAHLSAGPSRSDDDPAPPPAGAEATPPLTEAASDEATAERGGGSEIAASNPAAPVPATNQDKLLPATWTAEEDTRLVALVVSGIVGLGLTKKSAIIAAASELGRPEAGTTFRCHHKLKPRIDKALTDAVKAKAEAEALLTPSPEAAQKPLTTAEASPEQVAPERGGDAAVGGHSPAAVPGQALLHTDAEVEAMEAQQLADAGEAYPAVRDPQPQPSDLHGLDLVLWQHMQDNRPRWPMTRATDLELAEALARGEKLPMVAADLGIDAQALKNRWFILTARICDARGNPTIDGQRRLIEVLRKIVADAQTKAA